LTDEPVSSPVRRPPIRALLETDTVGGVWTFSLDLAIGLRTVGVDAHLAAVGPADTLPARVESANKAGVPIEAIVGPLEWQPDATPAGLARVHARLSRLARDLAADVVHACSYTHVAAGLDKPTVLTAHSDVFTWWHAVHGQAPPTRYDGYGEQVRQAVTTADVVVVPTRAYGDALIGVLALDDAMLSVVPNGRAESAALNGWTDDAPAGRSGVLAVGRFWDEGKNLRVLDALARSIGPQLTLAGAGGDTFRESGVTVLGEVSPKRVRRSMRAACMFVGPALYEPFGLAALEAAQAGCALVLSDRGTHREVWGEAAVYVDPTDPAAWRSRVEHLLSDPAAIRQRAIAAHTRAQRYTAAAMTRRYVRHYRDAISARPSPSLRPARPVLTAV
jgi:glycosyltransferase involved in cell wall biosynthesis